MDPLTIILTPGLAGGLVIALIVLWRNRNFPSRIGSASCSDPSPSTDVINVARIRVAGIGGLGLVAMATTVAVFIPRIRLTLLLGLGLGLALAIILIVCRHRDGGMPSSGRRMGANTILRIDAPDGEPDPQGPSLRHRGPSRARVAKVGHAHGTS
jgi:hypothetical protein